MKSPTRGLQTTTIRWSHPRYQRFSDQETGGSKSHPLDWRRWDPIMKTGAVLIVGGGTYYVAHLEQVPETGRWRFMNTSMQTEAELGEAANNQMKAQFRDRILPPNHPLSLHVKKVVTRILHHSNLGKVKGGTPASISLESLFGGVWTPEDDYPAAGRPIYGPEKEWDVIVINDKRIINAAAAPGKCMVMVFTGILPVCKDEQGLAAVLAHGKFSYITPLLNTFPNRPVPFFPEIGHVVARHSAERVSSQTVTTALLLVLQAFGLDYLFTRPLHTFLLELPNSRTQELEADLIGLRLMARACYNPRAAPEMFERLAKLGDRKVDFFDTHPSSERRVRKLEEALPEAYTILNGNPQCEAMREQLERFREREVSIRDDASLEIS